MAMSKLSAAPTRILRPVMAADALSGEGMVDMAG